MIEIGKICYHCDHIKIFGIVLSKTNFKDNHLLKHVIMYMCDTKRIEEFFINDTQFVWKELK